MNEALSPLGAAALDYAKAGWRVFPIREGRKQPLTLNGFKNATTDPDSIRWVWSMFPRANIGVATGDGLAVIDVDRRNGGETNPGWPATLTARTPSGGLHLFYTVSARVRNSAGRIAPGVDVRGDGAYVLVAPSMLASGRYEWVNFCEPARVDAAMFRNVTSTAGRIGAGRSGSSQLPEDWTPWQPRELVPEGERHDELVRAAGWLRNKGLSRAQIEDRLHAYNELVCRPPLDDEEVRSIATWAGGLNR